MQIQDGPLGILRWCWTVLISRKGGQRLWSTFGGSGPKRVPSMECLASLKALGMDLDGRRGGSAGLSPKTPFLSGERMMWSQGIMKKILLNFRAKLKITGWLGIFTQRYQVVPFTEFLSFRRWHLMAEGNRRCREFSTQTSWPLLPWRGHPDSCSCSAGRDESWKALGVSGNNQLSRLSEDDLNEIERNPIRKPFFQGGELLKLRARTVLEEV